MATATLAYDLYYRTAITATGFDSVDPKIVTEWTTDQAKALEDAGKLLAIHGNTKFFRIQSVILQDGQAMGLNALRQEQVDLATVILP